MDRTAKGALLDLYSELFDQIGVDRFEAAYKFALKTSKFRPDISELYTAAGISLQAPVESEALAELRRLIEAIRFHGPRMSPKRGNLIRDRDEDGRLLTVPEYEMIPPPAPSIAVRAALEDLGLGDVMAGLDVISRHPALNPPPRNQDGDGSEHSFRNRLAQDLERQWVQAYMRAKAEVGHASV